MSYVRTSEREHCIAECQRSSWWTVANFINLHTPITPCILLQWVLRDGETVNVNTCLLVEGDVIVLRPGQVAVAHCVDCLVSVLTLKTLDSDCDFNPNSNFKLITNLNLIVHG